MAERFVVLGWGGMALELTSSMDADVLVSAGSLRVSFTKRGGSLANAVVLMPDKKLLGCAWENSAEVDHVRAFNTILRLCPTAHRIELEDGDSHR